MATDGLTFDDYLSVRSAYAAEFGPSGERVTFLTDITGIPQVWAVDVDGGWPHQLLPPQAPGTEYGDPEADADLFGEIAPINDVDRIRAPLMILHGDTDPRVPMSETEQMVVGVKEQGGEVEYVRFEGEGHGSVKRANRLRAYTAIGDFLDRDPGVG